MRPSFLQQYECLSFFLFHLRRTFQNAFWKAIHSLLFFFFFLFTSLERLGLLFHSKAYQQAALSGTFWEFQEES